MENAFLRAKQILSSIDEEISIAKIASDNNDVPNMEVIENLIMKLAEQLSKLDKSEAVKFSSKLDDISYEVNTLKNNIAAKLIDLQSKINKANLHQKAEDRYSKAANDN